MLRVVGGAGRGRCGRCQEHVRVISPVFNVKCPPDLPNWHIMPGLHPPSSHQIHGHCKLSSAHDSMPIQILFMFEPCTLASGLFMYFLQILCTALPMLGKTLSKVRNVPLESFKIQPGVEHHKSKIGHFKWTLETNLCRSLYFFSNVTSVFRAS